MKTPSERRRAWQTTSPPEERRPHPLPKDYASALLLMRRRLAVAENFDVIEKTVEAKGGRMTLFTLDGMTKDGELQKLLTSVLSSGIPASAEEAERTLPCPETERTRDADALILGLLSGQTVAVASTFSGEGVLFDLRKYPARETSEPESDRVMQGAHDGFVETLVVNTSLIRRRIRDERLRMVHYNLGGASAPDVVLAYVEGIADPAYVESIRKKLASVRPKTLTLGFQSLAETLIRQKWYNPFPKIRTTERPDTAAAQLLEGNLLILCDTSPEVMILPTAIFDYLQQTDDYYYPPLTGSYLRLVRTLILLLSLVATPLWYLCLSHADLLPDALRFLIPAESGALPILLQLYLAELAIDGLKIASMNTPDMLSNSLSVVGALLLGDYAVSVGWFCRDVILYTAFIAIANFAQQNHELGYAFKWMRLILLSMTALCGVYGFVFGFLFAGEMIAKNATVSRQKSYLYPLVPFDRRALKNLLLRTKKRDFADREGNG